MLAEEVEVERSLGREGVAHIRIEVDRQQSATIVGAERYLAAWVRADGAVAEVGIAVGHALAQYRVPEQHTGLCALPCVVDNLLPQCLCINLLLIERVGTVDRVLLLIRLALDSIAHELIVYLHAHIRARYLALLHLRVDERLAVGVLDAYREH